MKSDSHLTTIIEIFASNQEMLVDTLILIRNMIYISNISKSIKILLYKTFANYKGKNRNNSSGNWKTTP